jgi:hypothetical protein
MKISENKASRNRSFEMGSATFPAAAGGVPPMVFQTPHFFAI